MTKKTQTRKTQLYGNSIVEFLDNKNEEEGFNSKVEVGCSGNGVDI